MREGRKGPWIALAAGWAAWLCGTAGSADCPGDPNFRRASAFKITAPSVTTRYFHDHSTAEIEAMWQHRGGEGRHNPGLTVFEHKAGTGFQLVGEKKGRSKRFCVWAESVTVELAITRMDVYVSRQYAYGTCQYDAILHHENLHEAINRKHHARLKARLAEALRRDRTLPLADHPLSAASMAEGQRIVSQRLQAIVDPIVKRFERECAAENARIDTPVNYRRLSAKCPEW